MIEQIIFQNKKKKKEEEYASSRALLNKAM